MAYTSRNELEVHDRANEAKGCRMVTMPEEQRNAQKELAARELADLRRPWAEQYLG
jgi:hypothetical protein